MNSVRSVGRLRRATAALLTVAVGSLFALVLLAWSGPATAAPAYPPYPPSSNGCSVSTTTVDAGPGDTITLIGSGFKANTTVSLSIPAASAALGAVTTTSSGTFSDTVTWPASVSGKSAAVVAMAGSTTCKFTLTNGTDSANAHRASGSGAGGSGGGGLSQTGFATLTATTIAVVLIGAGAMFLGLARRRRV